MECGKLILFLTYEFFFLNPLRGASLILYTIVVDYCFQIVENFMFFLFSSNLKSLLFDAQKYVHDKFTEVYFHTHPLP